MKPHSGPVTLQNLIDEGKLVWCYCTSCGHERDVEPATVPLPPDFPVPDVGSRMRCSLCGARKIATAPELYPGGIEAYRARFR